MEFNNNMTGNNIEGSQSYAFGQIHQEEYGQNNGSDSFEIHNQFCMTETQVNKLYFAIFAQSKWILAAGSPSKNKTRTRRRIREYQYTARTVLPSTKSVHALLKLKLLPVWTYEWPYE